MRRAMRVCMGAVVVEAACGLCAPGVRAELVELTASVQSEAEQIVDGQQNAFELGFEEFPTTTNLLPEQAEVHLKFTDGGAVVAQGRGLAIFSEPALDVGGNPQEIGVSAAVFSTSSRANHIVRGKVIETREFFFSAAEAGANNGDEITVASTLFPSGGLVVWGESGVVDLSDAFVHISITIVQKAQGFETPLATISADLAGQSNGSGLLTIDAKINGRPMTLNIPLNPPSGRLAGRVGGQGELPAIPINFTYSALVGNLTDPNVPFKIEATVEGTATAGPGNGKGAAFVLGGPLFNSINTSNQLARVINDTLADVAPARPMAGLSPFATLSNLCGVLGAETALLALLLGAVCVVRWQPRHP